jgi:hypothetical protein
MSIDHITTACSCWCSCELCGCEAMWVVCNNIWSNAHACSCCPTAALLVQPPKKTKTTASAGCRAAFCWFELHLPSPV